MKRIFLIFMLVVLPLQISWAAVTSYCQHEEGKTSQHFGHHIHKHTASADKKHDKSNPSQIDPDCGYCHLSCAHIISATDAPLVFPKDSTLVDIPLFTYLSYIPDSLIRPDWQTAS